jgi:hypothetical protein
MSDWNWKMYSITEDDYIEYARCVETLKTAGFEQELVEHQALKCHACCFSGRCRVSRESPFLGARTC